MSQSSSSQRSNTPQPWRSLSVGNLVSASFRLYRENFQPYLRISLGAALWSGLSIVLLILVLVISFATGTISSEAGVPSMPNWGVLVLLLMAWIVAALFCFARTLACAGALSRMAYYELIDQPESIQEATRFTRSRAGAFLGAAFLVGCIFFGLYIAIYLAAAIGMAVLIGIIAVFAAAAGQGSPSPEMAGWLAILMFGGILLVLLPFLLFLAWFSARLSMWEMPIAVERDATAGSSISRSMSLTKGSAWRIVMVLFIGFLITLPLLLIVQVGSWAIDLGLAKILPETDSLFQIFSTLLAYLLGILGNIFLLPFWQTVKAMIFYDLKARREGLGLELKS
jgi:uncharacterized membrane protein